MKTKQSGFTLIELMVTLAVAIIVLAIGVPWYDNLVANNRMVSQHNLLVTAINFTKSEAVSKNSTATLCPDSDADESTQVCGDKDDWANGWFVFNDINTDGDLDSGEDVIKVWQAMARNTDILATASSGDVDFIQFNSLGEKADIETISFRMTQVDDSDKVATTSRPRCIYLNAIGQLSTDTISANKGDSASGVTCP